MSAFLWLLARFGRTSKRCQCKSFARVRKVWHISEKSLNTISEHVNSNTEFSFIYFLCQFKSIEWNAMAGFTSSESQSKLRLSLLSFLLHPPMRRGMPKGILSHRFFKFLDRFRQVIPTRRIRLYNFLSWPRKVFLPTFLENCHWLSHGYQSLVTSHWLLHLQQGS